MRRARRLTLIDLIAAVGAAGVGLALVRWAAPGRLGPALIIAGPLVGILWQRRRGGRGIAGGALGGAAHAASCLLAFFAAPTAWGWASPSTMVHWPIQLVLMSSVCVAFGTVMGGAAWLGAAMMQRSEVPDPLRAAVVLSGSVPIVATAAVDRT